MGQYTQIKVNTHLQNTYDSMSKIENIIQNMNNCIVVSKQLNENLGQIRYGNQSKIYLDYDINENNEIVLKSKAKWKSYDNVIAEESNIGAFKTLENIAQILGNCDVTIFAEEGLKGHPNNPNGEYSYTTEKTNTNHQLLQFIFNKAQGIYNELSNSLSTSVTQEDLVNCFAYSINAYPGSEKIWKTYDNKKAITIKGFDSSDFYHLHRNHTFEMEQEKYPFGSETLVVNIFENGNISCNYKTENSFDCVNQNQKGLSFYKMLDSIKNPYFLEKVLISLLNDAQTNDVLITKYISLDEIKSLVDKIPNLEESFYQMQSRVKDANSVIYLEVPYSDKDEAKSLGAKWDKDSKKWYCKKGNKDNFSKWLAEKSTNLNIDKTQDEEEFGEPSERSEEEIENPSECNEEEMER